MEKVMRMFTLSFFGEGKHKISPEALLQTSNVCLLDVRTTEENHSVTIAMKYHSNVEVKHIPIHEIPDRVEEIPRNKLIAVFCPAQVRASIVYAYLLSKGFSDVKIVEGGYPALTAAISTSKLLKKLQH